MRFPWLCLIVLGPTCLNAQTTLFEENFNTCALSPGWTVQSSGDTNTVWYVGFSQNPLVSGQSIDSSCFLFIDDYSTPADTPGYVIEFITPAFDVTPYSTVECTMDVHFRFGQSDFFQILATDGVSETELGRFDNGRTNGPGNIPAHFTLKYDLALVSQSATTRIILRYTSPSGSRGKYAGVDNIKITGSGSGVNLIRESFDACAKPAGWETEIVNGQDDWHFGRIAPGSSAYSDGNSMDGSCFVSIDDSELGENAPPTTIRLYSPWFDGDTFFHYSLNFDLIFRYGGAESVAVYLQTGAADSIELYRMSNDQVGGPFFPQYVPFSFDLSTYRAPQMRVVFEYSDGGSWGYWAGIDNVKVTATGLANEYCYQAVTLVTGDTCKPANNSTALFDGPPAACAGKTVGSLWYRWQAGFTGVARFSAPAGFNNLVNIFTGSCANLQPLLCNNRDEHGFAGETTWFSAQAGSEYLIRISGRNEGYGLPTGDVCVKIDPGTAFPATPANDACANAAPLTVGGACPGGNNRNGLMDSLPSANKLARADVWYTFTAGNLAPEERYELRSNATFSDIITVYAGGCAALQEVAGNFYGRRLVLPALTPGQTYRAQIAGNFATIEDSLCPQLLIKPAASAVNDSCLAAIAVPVGGACVAGNNINATFSGHQPSCAVSVDRDIWFKFTAPAFGSILINTGADFRHTLAVWKGSCNDLKQVYCALNPQRCDGYVTVGSLNAGETYYVQIATWTDAPGAEGGSVCIRIFDGASPPGFQPLRTTVYKPCVGLDSVRLSAVTTGGTPPYTYTGTPLGQVVASGQPYLVAVTDAAGCVQYESGLAPACTANQCTLTASLTLTALTCPGQASGALNITTGGGTGPFLYNWSNGTVAQISSGLAAGVYTATVTDAIGCTATASATVTAYPPPAVQISGMIDFCPGDSTILTASGGIAYTWNTGAATAAVTLYTAGIYTVTATDANGCTNTASVTAGAWIFEDPDVLAGVKVFLQGPYVSNVQLMHDSLRVKNLIPLQEPYTGLSNFTHVGGGGEQTTPAVLAVSGPDAIVDWVFLELRSIANPAQVLTTRSALLQRDGDVVDVDGVSPVRFSVPAEQHYYPVARHRNHLGVQLGATVFYPGCVALETDFRSLPPQGFYSFNGLNPAQRLAGNQYMLWAGNGRVDFQLKYNGSNNDRNAILVVVGLSTPNAVVPGYNLADYNLDGLVKYNGSANDRNVLLGNVGITTPSAIVHDQVAR